MRITCAASEIVKAIGRASQGESWASVVVMGTSKVAPSLQRPSSGQSDHNLPAAPQFRDQARLCSSDFMAFHADCTFGRQSRRRRADLTQGRPQPTDSCAQARAGGVGDENRCTQRHHPIQGDANRVMHVAGDTGCDGLTRLRCPMPVPRPCTIGAPGPGWPTASSLASQRLDEAPASTAYDVAMHPVADHPEAI